MIPDISCYLRMTAGYQIVCCLKNKNEVFDKLKKFERIVSRQKENIIKTLRTVNGTEFVNTATKEYIEA